jgi:translocation and assembly module TamB
MEQAAKKKGGWRRFGRIVLKTVMWIFLLIVALFLLILTPPVQSFIRKKATNYLEKKLDTRVEIGRMFITLSGKIALDDIYIEDRQKDTLLSIGELRVNMSFYKIIFKKTLDINSVKLDEGTIKIKRNLPDTAFNFQFIVDAFGSGSPDSVQTTDTSASMAINIDKVELNKVHFVYQDVVTGNDVVTNIGHFDTRIEKFDPDKMHFIIPQVNLHDLTAKVTQVKPLVIIADTTVQRVKAENAGSPSPVLQLDLQHISLENIGIDYNDSIGAMYTNAQIGSLDISPRKIDLANQQFDLGKIVLGKTRAIVRMDKTTKSAIDKPVAKDTATGSPFQFNFASLGLDDVSLQFDNNNEPRQKQGMDYSHLAAQVTTLQVNDFLFGSDSIMGKISQVNFKEQNSGFDLQELHTDFLYSNNEAYLKDLFIKTPGSEIKRNIAVKYASLDALKEDIGGLQLDLDLKDSKILVKDVLSFVPSLKSQPAFADPNATWYINGGVKGSVADMTISDLRINGLADTRINMSGRLTGLPDMKKAGAQLNIAEISSSRRDMALFIPPGSLPKDITLPARLTLAGRINGNANDLVTDLGLRTDLGNVQVKGRIRNATDAQRVGYDVAVKTIALDLGTIMQDKETLGPLTASFTAKGTGFDPKTANAVFKGQVQSAVFKQYHYHDLALDGSIANQQALFNAGIADPNLTVDLHASADLSKSYPAIKLDAMIDSIRTKELNLTANAIVYRGKITADFPGTNPDSLEGKLFVTQSLLVQNNRRIALDTLQLVTGSSDTIGRYMALSTDFINAGIQGRYKLTELGNVFQHAIQPYFEVTEADSMKKMAPYDFTFHAEVINGPVLQTFVPDLKRMDSVNMKGRFSDSAGWFVNVVAPAVEIGTNKINGLEINAGTAASRDSIAVKAFVSQVKSGSSIQLDNTTLTAGLANNQIDFDLNIKGNDKDKYNVAGVFDQPKTGEYEFSLKPQGLILNFDPWSVSADNKIHITANDINTSHFILSQGAQQLSINSTTSASNSPLAIGFSNFKIATLTGFVQNDSTLVDGLLNGKAEVKDVMIDPVFTTDLTVTDLSVKKDTVGDLKMMVNNESANTFAADIALTGRGNDVKLNGKYFTNNSSFDMDLNINKLPLTTAQAFSGGSLRNATGYVNGKFDITGTTDKPSVRGDLNFNQAGFNLSMLNNYLRVDQEKIHVDDRGITFNRFQLRDSANNALTINGTAATSNFSNYVFNLDLRSDNFRALNSTKKDNKLFYGQLYFNSNLKVTGTEKAPVIEGRLKINDKTKLTVVLPQEEPGIVARDGVVEFVDMDSPISDSLFMAAYDSMNTTTSFAGVDVSVNIEIDKAADLTLIVDEGNGDFLNVKGEALLNVTVNPTGDIVMAGTYELEEGSYALNFNSIKRKFDIQKGSKITWGGEPTDADVNITARYVANTAPLDLVKGQLGDDVASTERNTYLQKLPFEVLLKMQGKLMKPDISFDIVLPDNKSYIVSNDIITLVRTKLDQLRQEQGEMNKQVFALLLLNRFVSENPFASSSSTSTGTLAKQSVSKLLTEQLNKLASDLVQGVDLNFDVQSSDDYTTGERRDRTDLNVGLSKTLLNDRLTVSVGSNFELEGPQSSGNQASNIAGNIAVNYRLSKDGRYQLRAYRKNEYQGVIDGYVIETGVGFIITIDYNKFKEIFQKKKLERQRKQRQEQRKKEKQAETTQNQKQAATP